MKSKLFTKKELKAFGEFILAEKKKQVFDIIDKRNNYVGNCNLCKDCKKKLKYEIGKVLR